MDEAGRLALWRHAQRDDRALAQGDQGQGRDPDSVSSRHRHCADHPRGRGPAGADVRQRRAAASDRRRQHAVRVQRREGGGAARDAIFRNGRQPRNLSQRLDRGDAAPHALGDGPGQAARLRRRCLGALRHHHGLDPGEGPRQAASGQAARSAAAVADRSGQVQRPAAGRPLCRAGQSGHRRAPAIDQGKPPAVVPRHGPADRKLDRQHQEQVACADRRTRRAANRRRRRHCRARRNHRRLEPLRQGRQTEILLQLLWREPVHDRGRFDDSLQARIRFGWSSNTTAEVSPKAGP